MNISPAVAAQVSFVSESWRTGQHRNQTTIGLLWSDKAARDLIDAQATPFEQAYAYVPVENDTRWAAVPMSYWGVHQMVSGGDPHVGKDEYHVDIPDTLADGRKVDLAALSKYGAALMVRLPRTDGTSQDIWLANTRIGGL